MPDMHSLALVHHTGRRLAEIGFLLILFAGVWLAAAHLRSAVRRGGPGRCRCRFRPRVWMFCASSEIEREKSIRLHQVRSPPYLRQAHAWHGHPDEIAHCANWPGFSRGLPTAFWCGRRASHRTTTTSAIRPWAGPPKSTRWSMRMAGCPAGSPSPPAVASGRDPGWGRTWPGCLLRTRSRCSPAGRLSRPRTR